MTAPASRRKAPRLAATHRHAPDDLPTGQVIENDCIVVMRSLPEESIDAVVCDPPYLIGFLGREWDSTESPRTAQAWHEAWAREAFRVLKPGGYLLAFGATRAHHRMTAGIEDAGFEIRDVLVWCFASGFPKGQDLGRQIDKKLGGTRKVVGKRQVTNVPNDGSKTGYDVAGTGRLHTGEKDVTEPDTPEAGKWDGWSTTLKPAWEPIVMARKPVKGSVVDNVLAHGTGALNIDATRVPVDPVDRAAHWPARRSGDGDGGILGVEPSSSYSGRWKGNVDPLLNDKGRWPANVVLTDAVFDGQPEYEPEVVGGGGTNRATASWQEPTQGEFLQGIGGKEYGPSYGDAGSYSRFFLIPKPVSRERQGSKHPTIKPVRLMMWLVRLVTPPGGLVLDPFGGSGSTGVACKLSGYRYILIERDAESAESARKRLDQTFSAAIRTLD